MESSTSIATEIEKQIDSLSIELKTLRLPHKLNQYRHYEKCLKKLKQMIENESMKESSKSSTLIEQIDQLHAQLDRSVICGVDKCFLCANSNDGTSNVNKSITSKPIYKQKQQKQDHNNNNLLTHNGDDNDEDGGNDDQMNDCDRLLEKTRAKLRCTSPKISSQTNQINPLKSVAIESVKSDENKNNSTVDSSIGNAGVAVINDEDGKTNEKLIEKQSVINGDINTTKTTKEIENNENISPKTSDNCKMINDQNDESKVEMNNHNENAPSPSSSSSSPSPSPSPSIDLNKKPFNNLSSTSLMMPRPFHKSSTNITNNGIKNNNQSPIITGKSPPIISSYKAYKDFINNYTTTATITATNK